MAKTLRVELHPETPHERHLKTAAEILRKGGLVAYPTDSGYAIGCSADSHQGIERLYLLKKPMKKFVMALLFNDFSHATQFAIIDNFAFRTIKNRIPGPYTFILPAEHRIARKLDVKRPEIGCRWPDHAVPRGLIQMLEYPLLNTAAKLEEEQEITDPDEIMSVFSGRIDMLLDVGQVPISPTTILKLGNGNLEVIRGEWQP